MKKLGFIVAILAIVAGIWIYLANQFEKMATEELLPKIKDNSSTIATNMDSIVINKFMFQLTLKNVVIFPEAQDFISSDKMQISYNPFTDKITIYFNGDKLSFGNDEISIYFPSPNQSISFKKSILNHGFSNFDDLNFTVKSKDTSLYLTSKEFSENDVVILNLDKLNFNFSSILDEDDMYSVDLSFGLKQLNFDSELLNKFGSDITGRFLISYKLLLKLFPIDYEIESSIKFNKDILDRLKSLQYMKDPSEIQNLLHSNNYLVSIKENINRSGGKTSSHIYVKGDGDTIDTNLNFSAIQNYTEEQKQELVTLITDLLYDIEKGPYVNSTPPTIIPDDLKPLVRTLLDIEKSNIAFESVYDIESSNVKNSFNIGINDFSLNLDGVLEDKIYELQLKVDTPKLLIDGISNFYQIALTPILVKETGVEKQNNIKLLDQFTDVIKKYGFDAIAAMHADDELKENEILISNFMIDGPKSEFKINGKPFFTDFLKDERIVKFLKEIENIEKQQQSQ